jgi:hypothetical protein
MSEQLRSRLFLIGALWNLLGGAAIVLGTGIIFGLAKLSPPVPEIYYYAWIALFMTFGIGYWMVSRDFEGNRNIVILGIIGKAAFSIIFIVQFFAFKGLIPPLFWIPVIGDLIFALLFGISLASPSSRISRTKEPL